MERRLILRSAGGLVTLLLLAPLTGQTEAPLTVAAAINKAGRQRMLSQRAAKAWLMLGLDIQPARARALLAESVGRFDTQLEELRERSPHEAARPVLTRLGQEWDRYRALLALSPTRSRALEVYSASELTQDIAHQLTLTYEKLALSPAARRVNVAGRQRMLSQRMAKFYLFQAWDINHSAARMELNWARAEFSSGMHQLYTAATDLPEAQAPLAELDRQWVRYRETLGLNRGSGSGQRALAEVAEQSEQILVTAEQLVTLFERRSNGGP